MKFSEWVTEWLIEKWVNDSNDHIMIIDWLIDDWLIDWLIEWLLYVGWMIVSNRLLIK